MKKLTLAILAAFIALGITACDRDKTETNDNVGGEPNISDANVNEFAVPISIVTEEFDKHFESCKSKEYINLDWTNAQKTWAPQFTECYNIEVNKQFESLSNKDEIALMQSYCELYFGDNYSSDNIFLVSDRDYPYAVLHGNGMTFDNAGARLNDYISEVENDDSIDILSLLYVDLENNSYLWKHGTRHPIWLTRGLAIDLTGNIYRPTGLLPSDLLKEYPYEIFYNDGTSADKTYKLFDGEYSIGEAIDYFTEDYFSSQPFYNIGEFSCAVKYVYVIKAADDMYFYLLQFTPTWNSIPFDTRGELITYNSSSLRFGFNSQALLVRKNDVDMAYDYTPPEVKNIGEPIDKMLTLEKAADIASEALSDAVKFEVRFAELIYSGSENTQTGISQLSPAWKFSMFNTNDGLYYNVYVNAVDGECSYYSYSPI